MPWDLMQLAPTLVGAYTLAIPTTIFWGILTGILAIGVWRRNRSVTVSKCLICYDRPVPVLQRCRVNARDTRGGTSNRGSFVSCRACWDHFEFHQKITFFPTILLYTFSLYLLQ